MGLLSIVIKRSWSLILLSIAVIVFYMVLNAPLPSNIIKLLRDMFNPAIPLISAILVGLFMQGVAVIYRMIEWALIEHKKDIDKMINEILEKYKHPTRPPDVIYDRGFDLNHLRVSSDLCQAINEIREKFGHLWEDLENHFPEVKRNIEDFCERLKKHEEELKNLEIKIEEKLHQYVSQVASEFNVNSHTYKILVGRVLKNCLERFKVRAIENPEEFISRVVEELDVKKERDVAVVGGLKVGVWSAEIKERTKDILIATIKEYEDKLRHAHEKTQELREYKEKEEQALCNELEKVLSLKVLPMKKVCKFI